MQIAFSIETLLDPATLTVEEVVGHLRAVEERLDVDQGPPGGHLLLTEQQWEARKKQPRGGGFGGRATAVGTAEPLMDVEAGSPPSRARC